MSLLTRIQQWTWAQDWRTWLAHFVIVGLVAFGAQALAGWWWVGFGAICYYGGREQILEGEDYTADRVMDAVSALLGGAAGIGLGMLL